MILSSIKVKNFRNYDQLSLELHNGINIFIGDNAQGKTNILEAIYVLAITKSHRMFIDNNLIQNTKEFSKIEGEVVKNENQNIFEIILSTKGKRLCINKNIIKKVSDYISKFNCIIFCPDDLEIVKGSPSVRRKFMNVEIGQINSKYLILLNEHNILLKNRNEYLKKITINEYDKDYLEALTDKLIDKAVNIYLIRQGFIVSLNNHLKNIYNEISNDSISIIYQSFIPNSLSKVNEIKERMKQRYDSYITRDIISKSTGIGVHRDDFLFEINGHDIREYGSQGQQRLAVLCLKLSEIQIFKEKIKDTPILLLDDVFSELDQTKRNKMINYIDNIQTIITTTDIANIDANILNKSKIYIVKNGKIEVK